MIPEDFYQLKSWAEQMFMGALSQAPNASRLTSQILRWVSDRYHIPADLRCSRTFLEDPCDARYIEEMSKNLFSGEEGDVLPPVLSFPSLLDLVVTNDRVQL